MQRQNSEVHCEGELMVVYCGIRERFIEIRCLKLDKTVASQCQQISLSSMTKVWITGYRGLFLKRAVKTASRVHRIHYLTLLRVYSDFCVRSEIILLNFFSKSSVFHLLRQALDCRMKELTAQGIGVAVKKGVIIYFMVASIFPLYLAFIYYFTSF